GLFVRHGYGDDLVEPPRPHQCGVDHVDPIGGRQDHDAFELLYPVELGQELAHDPLGYHAVAAHPSGRRERVDLVKEDDARRGLASPTEDLSDTALGLAHPLAEQLWPPHADEVRLALRGDRLCEERLARARRPIEQDALWHVVAYGLVEVGELERPFHSLL